MQWSDIQFSPTDRTLRQFAGILLLVFGLLAGFEAVVRQRPQLALVYAVIALTIGPLGLLWPRAVRPHFYWMVRSGVPDWMARVNDHPGADVLWPFHADRVFFPVIGRDLLARRRRDVQTYWTQKPAARELREYFRQS